MWYIILFFDAWSLMSLWLDWQMKLRYLIYLLSWCSYDVRFQQKTPLAWLDKTIVNMALYWLGHFHPIICGESKYWSQCDSGVHLGPKIVLLTTHLTHVRRVIFNPFPALGQNDVPILYLSLLNPNNSGVRFDGEVKAVI